jgi:hypothetical protein
MQIFIGRVVAECFRSAPVISPSHRPAVEPYIANQAGHHRKVTFQEEYRRLLKRYGIEYDERYVWV